MVKPFATLLQKSSYIDQLRRIGWNSL